MRMALQMDQTALQSGDNSLGAILNVQSHENRTDVTLHGSFRDPQQVGNVLIAVPSHQKVVTRDPSHVQSVSIERRKERF